VSRVGGIGRVVIAGAVDHSVVLDVGAGVARGVAHVGHVVGGIVDLGVLAVIVGVAGWDSLHLGGRLYRHLPGAVGGVRLVPYPLVAGKVFRAFLEDLLPGIGGILQVSAGDRLEFGIAVVSHRGGGLFPVDGRGLGNGVVQDRVLGLGSPGDVHQHEALDRAFGNPGEIGWQPARGHIGPGA